MRPIALVCHTLDHQVISAYRSETSRIKQHLVILSVGMKDEDGGLFFISSFGTWLRQQL